MTYDSSRQADARKPVTICELFLDTCAYEYGNSYTNLLTYSEQFDHANWTKTRLGTTVANAHDAVDGDRTADKVIEDATATNTHFISQTPTIALGATSFSVYAKAAERDNLRVELYNATDGNMYADFDLTNRTISNITNCTAEIIEHHSGWYRCVITATTTVANSDCNIYLHNGTSITYTGDGASGLYLWGAQCVAGSSKGHYVVTTTASATGACTAAGASGEECYNTFATCQDDTNYTKHLRTYRFYQPVSNWPKGYNGYPAIEGKPRITPTVVDPRGSLGKRGVVTVNLRDFADDDLGVDPYVSTRTYDPQTQGTFFGKLKARTPYYKGRFMKVIHQYINEPFDRAESEEHLYVIETLDFDQRGKVTITGKDLLKLADDKKAIAPAANTGTLSAAYTAGVSTTLVLQTGEGTDYDTDPYTGNACSVSDPCFVRVGDNVLTYTGVSTDTLTGVVGGQFGSTDDDLDIDDTVQQCVYFDAVNVIDIIHYLLTTYTDITPYHIPYDAGLPVPTTVDDEWDVEKASWLSGNDLTHCITEPTGINKLLQQICEQNLLYIWFDEKAQEVKLRAIAPELKNVVPVTLTDNETILSNSIGVKDNVKSRFSQIHVYYGQKDITDDIDKPENYHYRKLQIDTDSESENAHDEKAIRRIYANWMTSANAGLIITLAGRLLSRYAGTPYLTRFQIDMKDSDFWSGANAILDSIAFQDETGANNLQKCQIIKAADDHDKQLVTIEAETWEFEQKRYGYIAPNTMGDYTAESAANQAAYGFISITATGLYTNGDDGHLIA